MNFFQRVQRSRKTNVSLLMARSWGVQCDPWKGNYFVYGGKYLRTEQNVWLATFLIRPGNTSKFPSTQIHAAANFARCARCNVHDLSWAARDNRQQKRILLAPDLRHKEFGKAVNHDESARVAQLASSDAWMDRSASAALSSERTYQLMGPGSVKLATPAMVKELCRQGQVIGAIEVLKVLAGINFGVDKYLLYSVLKDSAVRKDLMLGGQVHSLAVKAGLGSDTFLCNHFIRMYAYHGKLEQAMDVFKGVTFPDAFTWSSIISAHVKQGQPERAIELYQHMRARGMERDGHVLVAALQACAAAGDLQFGKLVRNDVLTSGMEQDMFVSSCLVNMFAKCGSLKEARRIFDRLREKNVVTWNAMIAGYARAGGMGQEALGLYTAMRNEGMVTPNAVTFVCLLHACANEGVSALEMGKQLHLQLKDLRFEFNVVVGGSLVNMYVKCGSLRDARIVFDGLAEKNVVTWAAMIAGYAQQEGKAEEALDLYDTMHNEGLIAPNAVTFVCLLQACANVGWPALAKGKQLYVQLKERRLESNVVLGGSLVNMYVKCGSLRDARNVFDGLGEKNVVTWTAMIAGYAEQEGMGQEALSLYTSMHDEGRTAPDAVTFVCLLQACANVGVSALEKGKQLHSQLKDRGLDSNVVAGGSLVSMYVKCGSLKDARIVFDGLGQKDVGTWNSMISGYAQQEGMGLEALNIYSAMRKEGTAFPDAVTYMGLLQACASVGALQHGKQLHSEICEGGFETNVFIGTCLMNMYAKCGCVEVSRQVFDRLPVKDLVTWTALLKGYAEHGEGSLAVQSFEELLQKGGQPDQMTYTCLFTACSHAGLVDQGQLYFESMVEQHGVEPDNQLYCCMVDLLGRSGHLDRAEQMLQASGLASDAPSWRALLSACKSYGDAELGRRCFDRLVKLEPTEATAYLLLEGIYANVGKWDEVEMVESLRKVAGAKKTPAKACIEVERDVHEFTVGEERFDVAATVRSFCARVKGGGHVPQTQLVLKAVSEQEKEDALCGHAEKLALAYGLLHTPAGSPLVVTKNLRMCNDCHSSTKLMSRLEKREIVVRDGHKVHRFQNGACSCQDRP